MQHFRRYLSNRIAESLLQNLCYFLWCHSMFQSQGRLCRPGPVTPRVHTASACLAMVCCRILSCRRSKPSTSASGRGGQPGT